MPSPKVFIIAVTFINVLSALVFFLFAFLFDLAYDVTFLFLILFISMNLHFCTSSKGFLNFLKNFENKLND